MKKIFLFTSIVLLSFAFYSCGESGKDDSQNSGKDTNSELQKRYGLKSGVIEYVISGSQEGTKTLYFDNWGMRQAEYTRSILTVSGFTKPINMVSIIDGEYQYNINMDQNSGTRTRNPIIRTMEQLKDQKSFNEFGEQMLLNMGANKIGSEKFLGKDCEVYEMRSTGTKLWVWKWLTLKSETHSRGIEINLTATRINEGGSIPKEKFKVPEKVQLNEVDLDNIENEMREENK
jgi:hypothetical protein